ncbi:class I SAM-dependent methyltransferase [Pollutibacter soli]|uniref:class I SAM-dependent methyltransferase n=1 Tax=Pollutibacter soli TaxID=3034157 RepID=UPI0030135EAC
MQEEHDDIINICNITRLEVAALSWQLLLPDLEKIRSRYFTLKHSAFPFWARIWPAAKALGIYLVENFQVIDNKSVLEVGGGLGIPSIVASGFASEVICTDLYPEGLWICKKNAELNGIGNVSIRVFDWNIDEMPDTDVIIGSDISYDPSQYKRLEKLLRIWVDAGKTIVLSMPQRLQSVPFVVAIESLIRDRREYTIIDDEREVIVSVFRL